VTLQSECESPAIWRIPTTRIKWFNCPLWVMGCHPAIAQVAGNHSEADVTDPGFHSDSGFKPLMSLYVNEAGRVRMALKSLPEPDS
jgi:hypothetical protein